MLNFFKDFLQPEKQDYVDQFNENQKIQVAACTLLIEAAKADSNYSDDEYDKVTSILKEMFSLNDDQIHELMGIGKMERKKCKRI